VEGGGCGDGCDASLLLPRLQALLEGPSGVFRAVFGWQLPAQQAAAGAEGASSGDAQPEADSGTLLEEAEEVGWQHGDEGEGQEEQEGQEEEQGCSEGVGDDTEAAQEGAQGVDEV
jgi:hypothetical protein